MINTYDNCRYIIIISVLTLSTSIFCVSADAQVNRNIKNRRVAPYTNVECSAEYNKCNFKNALKLSESVVFFMHHNNFYTNQNIIDQDSVNLFQEHVKIHNLGVSAFNQGGILSYLEATTPKARKVQASLYACDIYMHYANCLHANGYIDKSYELYKQLYLLFKDPRGFDCSGFAILGYKGECASLLGRFDESEECYDIDIKNNELYNEYQVERLLAPVKVSTNYIIRDLFKHDKINYLGKAIISMYSGDIVSSQRYISIFEKKYSHMLRRNCVTNGKLNLLKGWIALRSGELQSAEDLFKLSLISFQSSYGFVVDNPNSCLAWDGLAEIAFVKEDFEKAKYTYSQTLKIRKKCFGDDHHDVAVSLLGLAKVAICEHNIPKASQYVAIIDKIYHGKLQEDHPEFSTLFEYQAELANLRNEHRIAEDLKMKSRQIRSTNHFQFPFMFYFIFGGYQYYASRDELNI